MYMLMVLRHKVLRRIFGPDRQQVTEGWKILRHEEFYNLCS